ncbi:MAG TPA: hypothetical protein VMB05_11475 [Solirubrobacteraceae bacterium]|nr:hypothetical protein [Solirubrobacteraceae bacterium]
MRRRLVVLAALVTVTVPAWAAASPADLVGASATLKVVLVPERLGHGTTIRFDFALTGPDGALPPPVATMSLLYPRDFGILSSGLGLATCSAAALEDFGPRACPSRSIIGVGTATGALDVAGERVQEEALTAVFLAPFENGNIALLFFLDAYEPLLAESVFDGSLQAARAPFGGALTVRVPPIATFPDGPNVALVRLRSTIGPLGITYYQRARGEFVPYQPGGIVLPRRCPHGGFPFGARFLLADGEVLSTTTTVPCPGRQPD